MKYHNSRQDNRPYIREVEFAFYNEPEIRSAVFESREKRVMPTLRNASGLSDPTASAAIRELSPVHSVYILGRELLFPESWLKVIDKTYDWCSRQKNNFFEIAKSRYGGAHFVKICIRFGISVNKFYYIMEQIRVYAALQAAQLNLIHVD